MLTTGQCATLACLLEVTAPKPGNVHRGADFEDTSLNDFVASAVALGPVMERAERVGATVLQSVQATGQVTRENTNLGIVLLLSPLAVAHRRGDVRNSLADVLAAMDAADAVAVYEAIRLAAPGGLQPKGEQVASHDIQQDPPDNLLEAMHEAAHRDLIAKQYDNDFGEIFEEVVPLLEQDDRMTLPQRIVSAHVTLMSRYPDSLIGRKCGVEVATEASARAAGVLAAGEPSTENYERALADLDFWLRCDGHRRNPGTTADLIAAGLFVLLCENKIKPPFG